MKFIFKISWFESKRHTKSHTDMYYENAEDTKWVFETIDWFNDLVRVEYIMVGEDTMFYKCAVENSNRRTANTFIKQRYFINCELGYWDISNQEQENEAKKNLIDMIIDLEIRNIKYEIQEELDIPEISKKIKNDKKNYSVQDLLDNINDLQYTYSHLVK